MQAKYLNQKGIGAIAAVIIVAILLLLIISASGSYFGNLLTEYQRATIRVVATQVLQDYAVLAQEANGIYVNNGNSCPGATYHQFPSGRPFCWSKTANAECIRVPADSNSALAATPFCLNTPIPGSQNKMDMSLWIEPRLNRWQRLHVLEKEYLIQGKQIIFIAIQQSLSFMEQKAWAQTPAAYLPPTAGAPTNDINLIPCDNTIAGNTFCKRCGPGAGKNVDCINLKVCVTIGGCANASDWYQQNIGIISR